MCRRDEPARCVWIGRSLFLHPSRRNSLHAIRPITLMSTNQSNPTAVVIGSGDMVVQCSSMLENKGFDLVGLYGSDAGLREWADHQSPKRELAYCENFKIFKLWAQTVEFDFLF